MDEKDLKMFQEKIIFVKNLKIFNDTFNKKLFILIFLDLSL